MIKKGGIVRDKFPRIKEIKLTEERKKTRFQAFYKDLDDGESTDRHILIESFSQDALSTTANSIPEVEKGIHSQEYDRAKQALLQVSQIQNKINTMTRNRLMTFKDSEIKRLDQNINIESANAMKHIVTAEAALSWIRSSKSQNPIQQKFIRNIEKSLAFEIRQATKSLRQQQKQFFDRIKQYQHESLNPTLQLTQAEKQSIKDDEAQVQLYQELQKQRDQEINKLVTNINKLSSIYKQMSQLVVQQGSLIDRIDYNVETALEHTKKGVQHLIVAQEHINSPFADRIIKAMVALILLMAMMLAYKYSR